MRAMPCPGRTSVPTERGQRGRTRRGVALALLAAVLCAGCVRLGFRRDTRLEPLPQAALQSLEPGVSDLGTALDQLGPPLDAWELPDHSIALAWGWYRSRGWRLRVSAPVPRSGSSASLDYRREGARLRGVVLFFDEDLRLVKLRKGDLRDL